MRFVRVDRKALETLLRRCILIDELREDTMKVDKSCAYDKECVQLELHNEIVYRRLLDE